MLGLSEVGTQASDNNSRYCCPLVSTKDLGNQVKTFLLPVVHVMAVH